VLLKVVLQPELDIDMGTCPNNLKFWLIVALIVLINIEECGSEKEGLSVS
jgi:hypothetical protein